MSMYPIKNRPKSNSHGRIRPFREKTINIPTTQTTFFVSSLKKHSCRHHSLGFQGSHWQEMSFSLMPMDNVWEPWFRKVGTNWKVITLPETISFHRLQPSIIRGELLLVQGVLLNGTFVVIQHFMQICGDFEGFPLHSALFGLVIFKIPVPSLKLAASTGKTWPLRFFGAFKAYFQGCFG